MLAFWLVWQGIGGHSVSQLVTNLESGLFPLWEFRLWEAFLQMFPNGQHDVDTARLMQTLIAINTPKGKSVPSVDQLRRGQLPSNRPQTAAEFMAKMKALRQA